MLRDVERELRDIVGGLYQIHEVSLSNVWSVARTVVSAVKKVVAIASEPPPPDPKNVTETAAGWRAMAPAMSEWHANDARQARQTIPETVWGRSPGDPPGQTSGDMARTSIDHFASRSATVGASGSAVASTLDTLGGAMEKARTRWHNAFNDLKDKASWDAIPANPFEAPGYVAGVLRAVVHGIEEMAGAYGDANSATETAKGSIGDALDKIKLPDHTTVAAGAVASVNNWSRVNEDEDSGGHVTKDPDGHKEGSAVRPGVMERADIALAAMSDDDRGAATELLNDAKDQSRREWIAAAIASGTDVETLKRFAAKLNAMPDSQIADLDPTWFTNPARGADQNVLEQPDQTTCGSSSLVVARMINDPVYAMQIVTGYDARTGEYATAPGGNTAEARFAAAAQDIHHSTNTVPVPGTGIGLPTWPERLGTPPWGAAAEMGTPGGAGVPGTAYRVDIANPLNLGSEYQSISSAVQSGQVVPLYVGNGVNGHIVLVTGIEGDSLQIYEPGAGGMTTISREAFVNNNITFGGGTSYRPWGAVLPQ